MTDLPKVKPEVAGGFRDYLPKDNIPRQRMITTIRGVYERFGFQPLETPGVEREEVLTGNDSDFGMQIFRIRKSNPADQDLALRFDLTVPLARVVAAYPNDIPMPFKRYHLGNVWRGEKPQKGRFREFAQFDADTVGTSSMMADAEIITMMYTVMRELGFDRFLIRVNNRKILNALPAFADFPPEKINGVMRLIDKMDKQPWSEIAEALQLRPMSEFDREALGLDAEAVARLEQFLSLRGRGREEILTDTASLLSDIPVGAEGIRELRELVEHVRALGVPDTHWQIDLSVARGLGYYTGPVFETIVLGAEKFGSVYSGGRFDGLVGRFSSGSFPATGASIGVDRLYAVMEELDLVPKVATLTQVIVLQFDVGLQLEYERIAAQLRAAGIRTELYLGDQVMLKGQLAYAAKQGIPFVIIMGPDEAGRDIVQLKNMVARTQVAVPRQELVRTLTESLRAASVC